MGGDDGYEKPVKSCLALHEMDLKPCGGRETCMAFRWPITTKTQYNCRDFEKSIIFAAPLTELPSANNYTLFTFTMKAFKFIALAAVACLALCFSSCTKISGNDKTVGSYTATCDINVSSSEGSGIIFVAIRDAVITASRGFDVRSDSNDKAVIAAADKAAEEHKNQANKKIVVSVVFQPGNAMGEAEKKPVVIKSYTFTPVN